MPDFTEPHWQHAALLLIDVQNDTLPGGASAVPGTETILPRALELAEAFRAADRPIAHVVRLYEPGGSDVDPPRRAAVEAGTRVFAPGTPGSQIAPGLLPRAVELDHELLLTGAPQVLRKREIIVYKPRWSAFHRTALEAWLREQDCDTVVVAGCNLPNCPRATLFDASERDLRAALASDAVSQASIERIEDLKLIGVNVAPTAEIIAEVERGRR